MATETPHWLYQLKSEDPSEIKELSERAWSEVVENVASNDCVGCDYFKSLMFHNGVLCEEKALENKLYVDFRNKDIQLPEMIRSGHSLPPKLDARLVRYAGFLPNPQLFLEEQLHTMVLSTWESNGDIHNIYLALYGREALLLVNAVSRLATEFTWSPERTREFHPLLIGRVKVSSLSKELYPSFEKGEFNPSENVMSFILDKESLSFFENKFSSKPVFDFRFYKEPSHRSVDLVLVSKDFGHIELRTSGSNTICLVKKSEGDSADVKVFDSLIEAFRGNAIQSQPQATYCSTGHDTDWSNFDQPRGKIAKDLVKTRFDTQSPDHEEVWQTPNEEHLVVPWLSDLYTGDHVTRNEDDTMMAEWCIYSDDLQHCINFGKVPHSTIESGGLDPRSTYHLLTTVENIKDQLHQQRIDVALSHLRGCMSVFKETLLQPVENLDEVELMKRIFYLTG